MSSVAISPSLLASDFSRLGEEVEAITIAGADAIHFDIMDGHFVPNLTIGPMVLKSLRGKSHLPFDVHLMIQPVDPFIMSFADAGADILTVHPEAGPHLHRTLQAIRDAGMKAGVALNPATPVETIMPILDALDVVLVMSVNPGFGGQKFIENQLDKICRLRTIINQSGYPIVIEVDGGVNQTTAERVISSGANMLVAGSAVFTGDSSLYRAHIDALRCGHEAGLPPSLTSERKARSGEL